MPHLHWHSYLLIVSFLACILGLVFVFMPNLTEKKPVERLPETEEMLFAMSFICWMVYCGAVGIQKVVLPTSEVLLLNLQLTAVISYFLTFSCVLCLPLHRLSLQQVE